MSTQTSKPTTCRFPFGPDTPKAVTFAKRLSHYKHVGFDAVKFHDDDAAPGIDTMPCSQILNG